jgi:hypothetical protein
MAPTRQSNFLRDKVGLRGSEDNIYATRIPSTQQNNPSTQPTQHLRDQIRNRTGRRSSFVAKKKSSDKNIVRAGFFGISVAQLALGRDKETSTRRAQYKFGILNRSWGSEGCWPRSSEKRAEPAPYSRYDSANPTCAAIIIRYMCFPWKSWVRAKRGSSFQESRASALDCCLHFYL